LLAQDRDDPLWPICQKLYRPIRHGAVTVGDPNGKIFERRFPACHRDAIASGDRKSSMAGYVLAG